MTALIGFVAGLAVGAGGVLGLARLVARMGDDGARLPWQLLVEG